MYISSTSSKKLLASASNKKTTQTNTSKPNSLQKELKYQKYQKLAVNFSKTPYHLLAMLVWSIGDLITIYILNYNYRQASLSDQERLHLLIDRIVKLPVDAVLYFLPAIVVEKAIEKKSTKIAKQILPEHHARYDSFLKIFSVMFAWILTMPLNEIIRPTVNSTLVKKVLKNPDYLPDFLCNVLNINKNKIN